jgi:DNA-binding MarR family transcriptional regulator
VNVSRAVARLRQKGLLTVSTAPQDGRKSYLELSSKGKKTYAEVIERARDAFSAAMARIAERDQKAFIQLFKRFLDGMQAPRAVEFADDPPLMCEIRRITRVCGLLGREVFGVPGLAPLTWQVLSTICTAPNGVTLSQLAAVIGASSSRLFALVQHLERDKVIVKRRNAGVVKIYPSPAGRRKHLEIESLGVTFFMRGGNALSASELTLFARLWGEYTGEGFHSEERFLGEGRALGFVRLRGERSEVRSFIATQRVAQNLTKNMPPLVGSPSSLIFVLRSQRALLACVEFARIDGEWQVLHLLCVDADQQYENFIAYATEQFFDVSGAKRVVVPQNNVSHALIPLIEQWRAGSHGNAGRRAGVVVSRSIAY